MHEKLFEILKKDHQELMGMLDKMTETSEAQYHKREDLLKQIKQEIIPHMRAEEKAFYSVLKENDESKDDALEAIEEHHAGELILAELEKMSKQDESWHAKSSVFQEIISHHIEEEEDKIFKDAEKVISHDQMGMILENFQKEKEKIKEKALVHGRTK
jgi:hypothetical protein